jgi:hypothetical protein
MDNNSKRFKSGEISRAERKKYLDKGYSKTTKGFGGVKKIR